ncbi:MAG: hypothetical protein AAF682_14820 [Planctomycetota bacterium]
MSENLDRYYRRRATSAAHADLLHPLLVLGLGAVVALLVGAENGGLVGWARMGGGVVLGASAIALFRGLAWGRWAGAAIFALLAVLTAVDLARNGFDVKEVFRLILCLVFAISLAEPATGERLAWMRGERSVDADDAPPPR